MRASNRQSLDEIQSVLRGDPNDFTLLFYLHPDRVLDHLVHLLRFVEAISMQLEQLE